MTKRQWFKLMIETSKAGKFPSVSRRKNDDDESPICRYRYRGRSCVAGLLIPDEIYDKKSMEMKRFPDVCEENPEIKKCIPRGLSASNVREVQLIHDNMTYDMGNYGKWNHELFEAQLRELSFFQGMK